MIAHLKTTPACWEQALRRGDTQQAVPPGLQASHSSSQRATGGVYHPTSGYIFWKEQNLLQRMESHEYAHRRALNIHYPFEDRGEWELGKFLCETLTGAQLDRFLKLEWFKTRAAPSFKNKDHLYDFMDALPHGVCWTSTEITLDGYRSVDPIHLIYRNGLDEVMSMFCNPIFANHMMYDPHIIYNGAEREFGEFFTGQYAFVLQVRGFSYLCDALPEGATLVPIILASDKTPVTSHSGGLEMHPLFVTIANIHSDVRMKATAHAWSCIAFMPIPTFEAHDEYQTILQARVWHRCMDIVCARLKDAAKVGAFMPDPLGNVRYAFTPLVAHVDPWDLDKYQTAAKERGLLGVHHPFWRDWALSDPALFLVPELLHTCHRFFFDHPLKWCKEALGKNELDAHYRSQHKHIGIRHFQGGVSHVNQMTGREYREIQRTIVPTIAGAVSPGFIRAIRALIDFIYQAQSPVHTERSILEMDRALKRFHSQKQAIIDAEARRGQKGAKEDFNIPKLELFQSFADAIKKVGNLIQFTADVSERLLITHCKHPFQKTSRQHDYTTQCVRVLNREETMRFFELYTFLRQGGALLVNAIASEEALMTYVDPTLSWVRRALPEVGAETRFTAPRPIRNYFLKGILSDDSRAALHVTVKPDLSSVTIAVTQQKYCLPDFASAFHNYLRRHANEADLNKFFQLPLKTWLKFRVQLLSVHNGRTVMPSQVVQAYPPSEKFPFGNCDTVLLNTVEQPLQLNAASVAQVRVVFQPKVRAPAILPPWLSAPLLYVQFFRLVHQDTNVGMWIVDRQFCRAADGQTVVRLGGVIPLTDVSHPVELIPVYGVSLDRTVTAETSLEIYNRFYLNDFTDKEMYHMLQNLDTASYTV
ncbi:hypothetical protein HYDPIDRAFT_91168 [Hydnomerulius pinastri MD-312]|uniref:DUF6830 domain-containing protein n=1 Tax=Hydnomerulius pinastri MD-312 TaxID=994086 RepID=A0A0C9W057_9AGAM|nr:hypothetical protein HYDPIDRAFT_91168 [Hydnomerulius pinastri MD-312]